METYAKTYEFRWADLDANGHVRYSAYIDATVDVRYRYFVDHGFPPETFQKLGLGAVYTALAAQFLREVGLGEIVTVTFMLAGLSPRGTRWKVQHAVLKPNGKKAAVIELEGTVLDLATRQVALPPAALVSVMQQAPRTSAFDELPESRWLKAR